MARAAAAVALAEGAAPAERKRIEAIAASTAEPRLRVVLERVGLEADDAALEAALAEMEAEEQRAAAHVVSASDARRD